MMAQGQADHHTAGSQVATTLCEHAEAAASGIGGGICGLAMLTPGRTQRVEETVDSCRIAHANHIYRFNSLGALRIMPMCVRLEVKG
jgi:hypothetical protein